MTTKSRSARFILRVQDGAKELVSVRFRTKDVLPALDRVAEMCLGKLPEPA